MIVFKSNPVGIDKRIQSIQSYLYENLIDWNLEAFGRAEIIDSKPHVFYKKNDYKDALSVNQSTNGKLFFTEKSTKSKTSRNKALSEIDIIFLLDVKKIKPNITHRADEEVRVEILKTLKNKVKRTDIDISKGVEALKGYNTTLKDMQPYHFVKFSFELNYKINEC